MNKETKIKIVDLTMLFVIGSFALFFAIMSLVSDNLYEWGWVDEEVTVEDRLIMAIGTATFLIVFTIYSIGVTLEKKLRKIQKTLDSLNDYTY